MKIKIFIATLLISLVALVGCSGSGQTTSTQPQTSKVTIMQTPYGPVLVRDSGRFITIHTRHGVKYIIKPR